MNAIKTFMKDYWELYKMNLKFWRKHWKAMAVITIVSIGAEVAIIEINNVRYEVKKNEITDSLVSAVEKAEIITVEEADITVS